MANFPNFNTGISCVFNGEEGISKLYRGCNKCPNTGKNDVYYEVGIKNKKKYPLSSHTLQTRCSSLENTKSFADHVKFQSSKTDQHGTQNPDDGSNSKSDEIKLEKLIAELDIYTSSLKAKLKTLRETEANTCNAEVPSPNVSCSSTPVIECQISDDEIKEGKQENEGMAAEGDDRLNISVEHIWEGESNVQTFIPITISDSSDDDTTDISVNENVVPETQ